MKPLHRLLALSLAAVLLLFVLLYLAGVAAMILGGIFGFGKKGSVGYYLVLERPDREPLRIPVIANKNQALICGAKNPLLDTRRRRGDANVVWDMRPIDRSMLGKLQKELDKLM